MVQVFARFGKISGEFGRGMARGKGGGGGGLPYATDGDARRNFQINP